MKHFFIITRKFKFLRDISTVFDLVLSILIVFD